MAKITEKQLIESLKQLKEIKPRKEWAVLLKSQILEEKATEPIRAQFSFAGVISNFKFQISNSFSRRMVYSFAVMLILIVGAFGILKLLPAEKASQNPATVSVLKQNVESLKNKITDLSNKAKANKIAISDIDANISAVAKNLKAAPIKDSATIKEIANSLKVLADMPGTDLTASPDIQNLTQTIVQSEIADYKKATLTEAQQKILADAQGLYNQGNYNAALEKIWDLANSNSSTASQNLTNTASPANQ